MNATETKQIEAMKTFTFGVEIETIGIGREKAARVIAATIGGTARQDGGYYGKWVAVATDGRLWTAMSDASIQCPAGLGAEVVTPILTYADLDTLQNVVRALAKAGAKVNASCGLHVHVGAAGFDAKQIANLAKYVAHQEELLVAALGVQADRLARWTKKVDQTFVDAISARAPQSMQELNRAWYGREAGSAETVHYHQSRYRGLNLHSLWYRGTIEFRYFEATLHAGKVKTYVQLCLALAAKGRVAKSTTARKRSFTAATAKYDVRVILLRLGMIGDEFKTARHHMLAGLQGSSSFKNGRPVAAVDAAPASPVREVA